MTTGLLDRLRSTKRTRQREAVETIHRLAQKAASGKLTKDDDDALVNAIAQANLSDSDFAQLVNDLRQLREHEQQAAELDGLRSLVGASREALRSFDEHRAQQIAEMDQERARLDGEYKAAQVKLRKAQESASAADELRYKHGDVLADDDDRDLDHCNITMAGGSFGAMHNGVPGAEVVTLGRTRFGREIGKRTALRQLRYTELLAEHEQAVREWENGRHQQRLGEAQRERDERHRAGVGIPEELDQRIGALTSKIDDPPKRPDLPTWGELVKQKKQLGQLIERLHERMGERGLERTEDGYNTITHELRDSVRGGTGRK